MLTKTKKATLGIALFSLLGLGVAASSASADEGQDRPNAGPCKADVERLCGDVERGEGRIKACMQEHQAELSQGCSERIEKRAARKGKHKGNKNKKKFRKAMKEACGEDVQNFCGDVEKGSGELKACIQSHQSEFSQTCQDAMAKAKKHHKKGKKGKKAQRKNLSEEDRALAKDLRQEVKNSCQPDAVQFCSTELAEGNRRGVRQCIQAHSAELSSACSESIDKARAFKQSLAQNPSN